MNKLKQSYADSLLFFRQGFGSTVRTTAWAMAGLIVLGFTFSMLLPEKADGLVESYARLLLQGDVADSNGKVSLTGLLLNNIYAMMIAIAYGLLPFIRLPALTLGINGAILGMFAGYYVHQGLPLWQYLLGILPHGIFELPALALSVALGLYLCDAVTQSIRKHEKGIIGPAVSRTGQILTLWILPLLLVAAPVETYVTPAILKWL